MMQDARSRTARSPHENLHPADSSVSGEEFLQDWYWCVVFAHALFGFNWGQGDLATLVTPQNCTKMLRNLTFVVQFAYFCTSSNKEESIKMFLFFLVVCVFFVGATLVTKSNFWPFWSNFWATLWEIAGNVLGNLEQLVKSLIQIAIKFHPYMALVRKLVFWLFETYSFQCWNSYSCSKKKFTNHRSRYHLMQKTYYYRMRLGLEIHDWLAQFHNFWPMKTYTRLRTRTQCNW